MHSNDAVFIRFLPILFFSILFADNVAAAETMEQRRSLEVGTVFSRTSAGELADAGISPGAFLPAPMGSAILALEFPRDGLIGFSFETGLAGGGFRTVEKWRFLLTVPLGIVTRIHFGEPFALRLIAGFQVPIWYGDEPFPPLPIPAVGLGADVWDTGNYRWFVDFEWVPVVFPFATTGEENGSFVEFYLFTVGVSR